VVAVVEEEMGKTVIEKVTLMSRTLLTWTIRILTSGKISNFRGSGSLSHHHRVRTLRSRLHRPPLPPQSRSAAKLGRATLQQRMKSAVICFRTIPFHRPWFLGRKRLPLAGECHSCSGPASQFCLMSSSGILSFKDQIFLGATT
jgi:hypothetical protein